MSRPKKTYCPISRRYQEISYCGGCFWKLQGCRFYKKASNERFTRRDIREIVRLIMEL